MRRAVHVATGAELCADGGLIAPADYDLHPVTL
jgi:hypothetical protein